MSFDAGGRFAFLLGSKTPIPAAAFAHRPTVYFEFKVDGERFGDGHGRLRRARCRGGDVRDPRRLLRKEPPHLSSDTVDSRHILDASIGTSDIADRSIRGVDIALSAVDSGHLQADAVGTQQIRAPGSCGPCSCPGDPTRRRRARPSASDSKCGGIRDSSPFGDGISAFLSWVATEQRADGNLNLRCSDELAALGEPHREVAERSRSRAWVSVAGVLSWTSPGTEKLAPPAREAVRALGPDRTTEQSAEPDDSLVALGSKSEEADAEVPQLRICGGERRGERRVQVVWARRWRYRIQPGEVLPIPESLPVPTRSIGRRHAPVAPSQSLVGERARAARATRRQDRIPLKSRGSRNFKSFYQAQV